MCFRFGGPWTYGCVQCNRSIITPILNLLKVFDGDIIVKLLTLLFLPGVGNFHDMNLPQRKYHFSEYGQLPVPLPTFLD